MVAVEESSFTPTVAEQWKTVTSLAIPESPGSLLPVARLRAEAIDGKRKLPDGSSLRGLT